MKREVLLIFLMAVGLLTGGGAGGRSNLARTSHPGKFIFDR